MYVQQAVLDIIAKYSYICTTSNIRDKARIYEQSPNIEFMSNKYCYFPPADEGDRQEIINHLPCVRLCVCASVRHVFT